MTDQRPTAQQWQESGSRSGHMQTVVGSAQTRIQEAYRAFIVHTQACGDCRMDGLDCEEARQLRQAWRDAKATP